MQRRRRHLLRLTLSLTGLLALSATRTGDRWLLRAGLPRPFPRSNPSASWEARAALERLHGTGAGGANHQADDDRFYRSDVTDHTLSGDGDLIHVSFGDGTSVSSW